MTRYRLSTDPETGRPYMKPDPEGVFYSTGEVDREVAQKINQLELAIFSLKMEAGRWKGKVDERDGLIRRAREELAECYEFTGQLSVREMIEEIDRAINTGVQDAAGTNDGGTVSNGDGAGTGQNDAPLEAKREE